VLAAELALQLQALQRGRDVGEGSVRFGRRVGVTLRRQLCEDLRVLQLLQLLAPALQGLEQLGAFLQDLLRRLAVAPEVGGGGAGIQLGDALLAGVDVKDASRRR
jgi:hypothetical protein